MSKLRRAVLEVHRRSLWQVVGIYGVASWVVHRVVLALYARIGLPGWVPGASMALLLLGLPLVIATAFVQEGAPLVHRRTPWQVLGIYAVGSWVVYQVVLALHEGIGLADWVPATTIVLLLLGLPLVLAIPVARGEGAAGYLGGTADPLYERQQATPGPRAPLLTWPRAITACVLSFAALGMAATGFMGLRALGIGPAATLLSGGELAGRPSVLVGDFGSPPPDSLTAFAVGEAIRIDLAQSRALTVVERPQLRAALARMELPGWTRLTEEVALQLAVREGIAAVLVGEVIPVGPGYQITTRMIKADSSRVLIQLRERAVGPDDLLPAMDRLIDRLLERTGESLRSIRASQPLAALTTSSLDALRIYSQAQRATELESDHARAEELLEQALALDSTFAMAWRKIGAVRSNQGDRTGSVEAFTRAFQLSERLPEMERLSAAATYFFYVDRQPDRVIEAYERMIQVDSTRSLPYNNLAVMHALIGEYGRAVDLASRAAAIDSNAIALGVLAGNSMNTGDTVRARQALEARIRLYPQNVTNGILHRQLLYLRGEVAAVHEDAARVLATGTRPSERSDALRDRAQLELRAGRILAASRTFDERHAERLRAGLPADESLLTLATAQLVAAGDAEAAAASLGRYVREIMPDVTETDRPFLRLAATWALLGDPGRARATMADWERAIAPLERRRDEASRLLALGLIAVAEGRVDDAVELLRSSTERTGDAYFNRAIAARGYDMVGRSDLALRAYEQWQDTPHWNRIYTDALFLGRTLERMAELHEMRGEGGRAAEYYGRLVALWKDADPEFQSRVEAAVRALRRLTAERAGSADRSSR